MASVADNGYRWWYIDGLSDDGLYGVTVIVFVGCVFSPHYFAARQRQTTDPREHVAVNAILYGKGGKRWSLTERGRSSLLQREHELAIGPSRLSMYPTGATLEIREITVPLPGRLRGTLAITPLTVNPTVHVLDDDGLHRWRPIWPSARIRVDMSHPRRCWEGDAYVDSNWGAAPLEDQFSAWDWSRLHLPDGRVQIRYNRLLRNGAERKLALTFNRDGSVQQTAPQPNQSLAATPIWRMQRSTSATAPVRIIKTLEDTPFYSRSLIQQEDGGLTGTGFHESVSLQQFCRPWVQRLLPFRLPRAYSLKT